MIRRGQSRHRSVVVRRERTRTRPRSAPARPQSSTQRAPMALATLGVLSFVLGASGLLRSLELVALTTTLGLSLLLVALALEREA